MAAGSTWRRSTASQPIAAIRAKRSSGWCCASGCETGDSTVTCEPILKAPARKSQVGTYTPVLATSALASTLDAEFDSHHIVLEKTLGKTEVQDHVAPNWTWPFR